MKEYGLRWSEFDKQDRVVMKERFFGTEAKRSAFVANVEEKGAFNRIVAWHDPAEVSGR